MRFFISIVLLITCSNIYAANITAKLDVSPVLVSDTFHLTYTASGSVDDDPDFSPIKTDFELLGTQQSSNMSMINGSITRSKTWTLTLIAKATGIFTIPTISFGSDQAPKINVVVKAIPTSNSATPNQNFILEMEPSQKSGYIQQQFIITIRLLVAKNINNYQFSDLTTSTPDTIILPLGKDQQYKTYRGKKQYIVIEKKFALFPQKTETLKINPFVAAIAISSNANSRFYDPFNTRTTTKRLHSKAVSLNIKDIPSQYTSNNWLPSSSIKLSEEWPQNKKFIAGEPITRTLSLLANGLTSSQLIEIAQPSINGLKQYPDKPESLEQQKTDGLIATRKQKIAIIPTQAGSYTLPAISIPWWNTIANKIEIAHLPKRTFTVLPALNNTNIPITSVKQPVDTSVKAIASALVKTDPLEKTSSFWFWLSMFSLVLWLVTFTLWLRYKSNTTSQEESLSNHSQSISSSLKQLKMACSNNDAKETKVALLNWAKLVLTEINPNNLSDIANQVDESLKQDIISLNDYLYNPNTTEWHCNNVYQKCKDHKQISSGEKAKTNSAILEPFKYRN